MMSAAAFTATTATTATSAKLMHLVSAARACLSRVAAPIMISEDSPFYEEQPTAAIKSVVEKETARVAEVLDNLDELVRGPVHMGSTAIVGMPGTPVVDLVCQLKTFPPSGAAVRALEAIGYEYHGSSPHDKDDFWCFGGSGPKGHLGRVTLHLSSPRLPFLNEALNFVAFCNSSEGRDAFQAYANVKLEGARLATQPAATNDQDGARSGLPAHVQYKIHKAKVVRWTLEQSRKWAARAERESDEVAE